MVVAARDAHSQRRRKGGVGDASRERLADPREIDRDPSDVKWAVATD
jgi:hypothetical protein